MAHSRFILFLVVFSFIVGCKKSSDFGYSPINNKQTLTYIDNQGDIKFTLNDWRGFAFNESLARVQNSNGCNFINHKGKLVSKTPFQSCLNFENGFAAIQLNDKWGFINVKGKIVIEPAYANVQSFSSGFALVKKEGLYYYINREDELLKQEGLPVAFSFSEGLALTYVNDKAQFINDMGEIILNPKVDCSSFHENKALYQDLKNDSIYVNGFIDKNGNRLFESSERFFNDFSEGMSIFHNNTKSSWGSIDSFGNTLFTLDSMYEMSNFKNGLSKVTKRQYSNGRHIDKYGFVDRNGQYVIPPTLDYASNFTNGLAWVSSSHGSGYMNTKGDWIYRKGSASP